VDVRSEVSVRTVDVDPAPPGTAPAAIRLGVITPCYDPEAGSAAIAGAICRSLVALGHEVHALTGFPNYPKGTFYPGYRPRPYRYERLRGVHVHRVPLVPSHNPSPAWRAATYLSFAAAAASKLRILRSVDAWLVISSQATAALPAMLANRLYGVPYVLLIQDLWPQTVQDSGFVRHRRVLNTMVRCLHAFCDTAYRRAATVAVTAPGMADALRGRAVPEEKLAFVPNWVDESLLRPVPADPELGRRLGLDGFVVMYAGALGDLQGLETAIEAVGLLRDLPDLRLVFAGSGVAEQRLRAAARAAPNIVFLGQQPVDRVPQLMAHSDVQLVSLKDLPLFRATLPSKVQAALSCGRPIVGAVAGDAARVIEQSGAGVAVPPGDPHALALALRNLHRLDAPSREAMGRAGYQYYLRHFSARVGSVALANLVSDAIGGVRQ
jgi:glycosyltransferase involved in cell wall biosynthesis